jgi:hypothetical protein
MKKILTIAGTGRCGTTKLQTILKLVDSVFVEMNETDESLFNVRIPAITEPSIGDFAVKRKLIDIETNPEYTSYDTFAVDGHVTGNNFIHHFYNNGVIPHTFILRRTPREVAKSLFRLQWIPGKNKLIIVHFNGPDEADVMPYAGWQKAHAYQLCFWYCCEIERRLRNVKQFMVDKKLPFYEMTMEQMLDVNQFNKALVHFQLPVLESIPQHKENESEFYKNSNKLIYLQEDPPDEFLYKLEMQVLDNIPVDDRDYILRSWKTFWPDLPYNIT